MLLDNARSPNLRKMRFSKYSLTLMGRCTRRLFRNIGNRKVTAYMRNSTKCVPVKFSAIDSGLEKLERSGVSIATLGTGRETL